MIKAIRITALARRLAGMDDSDIKSLLYSAELDFVEKYADAQGNCIIDEQAAIAIMLENGLCENSDILSRQLAEVVIRDELKLTCGMVGVQYLYGALTKAGRADLAYKMITESDPGYKTWYEAGATTLWERWDGRDAGSHNHHMFSGVIAWFYKSLLGIAPSEAHLAFDEVELTPCFIKELGFVKGSLQTVKGRIGIEWKYDDGKFIYTVDLPQKIKAYFKGNPLLPGKNIFVIESEN